MTLITFHLGKMPKVVPEYKEQARKRILEAASAEFAQKGYRKTTMGDIARRMGVSKGAVYQYFESKEALIGAVGDSFVERAIKSEFSSSQEEGLIEITQGAFGRTLNLMPSWFPTLICDVLSEAHRDRKARKQVREIEQKIVIAVSGFWEERKKAGEIHSSVNTERIARGLLALQLGLMALVSTGLPRSQAIEIWTETIERLGHSLERSR